MRVFYFLFWTEQKENAKYWTSLEFKSLFSWQLYLVAIKNNTLINEKKPETRNAWINWWPIVVCFLMF